MEVNTPRFASECEGYFRETAMILVERKGFGRERKNICYTMEESVSFFERGTQKKTMLFCAKITLLENNAEFWVGLGLSG